MNKREANLFLEKKRDKAIGDMNFFGEGSRKGVMNEIRVNTYDIAINTLQQIDEPIDTLAQEYDVEPETIREWLDRGHAGSFEKEAPRYQYPIKTMPALIADITHRKNLAKVALDKLDKEMYTTPIMRLAQQKYEIYSNVVKSLNDLEPVEQAEKVEVPDYVAEWYETNKASIERAVSMQIKHGFTPLVEPRSKFDMWFFDESNHPIETLIRMKDGYTVKPKRWVVKDRKGECVYELRLAYTDTTMVNTNKTGIDGLVFTDRAKAEAVATLVEGTVVEID